MNTPYSMVCDLFLDKITEDSDYFKYDGLGIEETVDVINKRTISLMSRCLVSLQKQISPKHKIDFTDVDSDYEEFKWELNNKEIDLLSEKMVLQHYKEKKLKVAKFNMYVGSGTMKVFSPAEERRSYLELLSRIEADYNEVLSDYDMRIRGIGEFIY